MGVLDFPQDEEMDRLVDSLYQGNYLFPLCEGRGRSFTNDIIDIGLSELLAFRRVDKMAERDCQEMTRRTVEGERYSDPVLDELVRFPMTEATVRDTHFGRTITQGMRPHLFRGENSLYPRSESTLARKLRLLRSDEERRRYALVAYMRIASFLELADRFDISRAWCAFYDVDFLTLPLAQHYGLETPAIDFTDDFETALFFATCKWDSKLAAWRPLSDKDIAGANRYGMLFHVPRWQAEQLSVYGRLSGEGPYHDHLFAMDPIGFQPFMRCHMQHGYACYMDCAEPLQENPYFEKLRFEQSVELSRVIFELMEEGHKVFPNEGLSRALGTVDQIKDSWAFSDDEFACGYDLVGGDDVFGSREEALRFLRDGSVMGRLVTVGEVDACFRLDEGLRQAINKEYEDYSLETASGGARYWSKPRSPYDR